MRRPIPPSSTLSTSGNLVVWESGHRVGAIDLGTGSADGTDIDADDVLLVAVSPAGGRVALVTSAAVSVLDRDDGWGHGVDHEIAEPFFRVAVADSGSVVGVTAHDDDAESILLLIDGDRRIEQALGNRTAFTLLVDAERRRVLVAGQEGTGSYHGGGDPFVRLYEWADDEPEWNTLWEGPAPVESANGWIMPLTFGDIGVYESERLVVISPDSNPDDVGAVDDELQLDRLETVVASPDGGQLAWFWSNGDHGCVRSSRLADRSVVEHPDVDGIGSFPTIAVSDDGTVTLVDTVRPSTLRVRTFRDGDVTTVTRDLAVSGAD